MPDADAEHKQLRLDVATLAKALRVVYREAARTRGLPSPREAARQLEAARRLDAIVLRHDPDASTRGDCAICGKRVTCHDAATVFTEGLAHDRCWI